MTSDDSSVRRWLRRWLLRRREGPVAASAVAAAVGIAVVVAAAAGFFLLAHTVVEGGTAAFDDRVLRWTAGRRGPWLDAVAREVTALGNTTTLVLVVLLAAVFFRLQRGEAAAWTLVLALVSGVAANRTVKALFSRPRPDASFQIVEVLTPSFPSAHAMMSAVVYGTLAHLLAGRLGAGLRRTVWTAAVVLVVAVGASRVYLGVHFPSDVAAGWLGGLAWTALLVFLRPRHQLRRGTPPSDR